MVLRRALWFECSVVATGMRVLWPRKSFRLLLVALVVMVSTRGLAQESYDGEVASTGPPNAYSPPVLVEAAQIDIEKAYMVKSVYLLRFTRFISWPNFSDSEDFHFGVLGDSPIIAPLQKVKSKVSDVTDKLSGEKLPIRVSQFANVEQLEACHILFIAEAISRAEVQTVLKRLKGTQTLIVGETPEFADEGGAIGLVIVGPSVNFVVNVAAAKEQGLTYSAQMLKAAYRVVDKMTTESSVDFSGALP